jgi:tripeptide aminopeptidase
MPSVRTMVGVMNEKNIDRWFSERILKRFLSYVTVETSSDRHSSERPTTSGQWKLAKLLAKELAELGVERIDLDENCFLTAFLPSNVAACDAPAIGFMAHMDTSQEVSGKGVKPVVHNNYNGKAIHLKDGTELDPKEFPDLKLYRGQTIITSDGTTLLGADDKAGIAEIMTGIEYLIAHPEIPHGKIEIIFTPDEETGFGMGLFPKDKIKSQFCYTLDGNGEGVVEAECFEAYRIEVSFKGKSIHPGKGRGKLVNAVEMATTFLSMIPKEESPQATDDRYGYYQPLEIGGNVEKTSVAIHVRDFEPSGCRRRIKALKAMAKTTENIYPGGKVTLRETKQYSNMKRYLKKSRGVLKYLEQAVRETGIEPHWRIIRGGTDGARLSEMGIPTPNIFTGGYNYHSELEWAGLPSMVKAAQVVVNLARIWAEKA